ncbi:ATP-binding protein [Nocardioides sp. BYT-33-1]|uniref:ATP-binding protein n=1 Tax=Nocardioides sp. BYT-33-1 TaxID=3416952 RepID=UPI003F53D2D7
MSRRELDGGGAGPLWLERLTAGEITVPGRRCPRLEIEDLAITGFPAASGLASSAEWLRSYAGTIAERSVEDRRDPVRVHRLLRVLAESESQAVPDEQLWRSADINRATLAAYDQMLTRTHIRADLPAWESNRLKRITTYPKRQYVDAALALALARIGPDELHRDPALAGRYLESFVAAQLRPECDRIGGVLHHLRTKGGEHEVDLLVELDDGIVAAEVKAGVVPRPADARHLVWLREQLGDRVRAAVVLHRGEATFELVDGVWAVPITSFWT